MESTGAAKPWSELHSGVSPRLAISAVLLLFVAAISRGFGLLPAPGGDTVRAAIIWTIGLLSVGLAVCGLAHIVQSVALLWKSSPDDVLAKRLSRLADLGASADLLVETALDRPYDGLLALMTWGSRGLLLLGLLGTVLGLGQAVQPIAESAAKAQQTQQASAPSDSAGSKVDAADEADGAESDLIAQTGRAVGSLGTAFGATAWSVAMAALVLLMSMLCAEFRAGAHDLRAWDLLRSDGLLERVEQHRAEFWEKAGEQFTAGADSFESAVKKFHDEAVAQFSTAATSIATLQSGLDTTLAELATTLDGIGEAIKQSLTLASTQLGAAAAEAKSAGSHLNQSATKLTKAGDKVLSTQGDSLRQYREALDEAVGRLQTLHDATLQQHDQSLQRHQQTLAQATDQLLATLEQLRDTLQELPAAVEQLPQRVAEATEKASLDLFAEFQGTLTALQTYLYWMDQNSGTRSAEELATFAALRTQVEELQQTTGQLLRDQQEALREVRREQEQAGAALLAAQQEAGAALVAAQQEAARQLAEVQVGADKQLLSAYAKVADTQRQAQESLRTELVAGLHEQAAAAKALGATFEQLIERLGGHDEERQANQAALEHRLREVLEAIKLQLPLHQESVDGLARLTAQADLLRESLEQLRAQRDGQPAAPVASGEPARRWWGDR